MRYQQHDGAEMTDVALHCTAALVNVTRVTPGRSVAVTARDKLSLSAWDVAFVFWKLRQRLAVTAGWVGWAGGC